MKKMKMKKLKKRMQKKKNEAINDRVVRDIENLFWA